MGAVVRLPEGPALEAALCRLAAAEASATVMVDNPLYRVQVALSRRRLQATVTLTDFADYALTMDLLETELVDALATADPGDGDGDGGEGATVGEGCRCATSISSPWPQPWPSTIVSVSVARSPCWPPPDLARATASLSRTTSCWSRSAPARVLNVTGRLAVVPKAFHCPTTEAAEEAHLSASLERELEEELLGREDLEQVSERSFRRADPFHADQLSEPMR